MLGEQHRSTVPVGPKSFTPKDGQPRFFVDWLGIGWCGAAASVIEIRGRVYGSKTILENSNVCSFRLDIGTLRSKGLSAKQGNRLNSLWLALASIVPHMIHVPAETTKNSVWRREHTYRLALAGCDTASSVVTRSSARIVFEDCSSSLNTSAKAKVYSSRT